MNLENEKKPAIPTSVKPETKSQNKTHWMSNSVTLKLIIITILMLLLLIPASMIKNIIKEREHLNKQAISEVSDKWAQVQQVNGPLLTIPITYERVENEKTTSTIKYWYILPENLNINGKIDPETLKRGIYEVVVYKSDLHFSGNFNLNHEIDSTNLKSIDFNKAFLTLGISDLRGIKNKIKIKWNNQNLSVEPGSKIKSIIETGVTVNLPGNFKLGDEVKFDFNINLNGSQNLSFVPLGSNTIVNLNSTWDSPSFNGKFLPDNRAISKEGFTADWKVLELNRNFPKTWLSTTSPPNMHGEAFGCDLLLPLDDYQKTMRSAKYAVMTICLTFLIFFLVEISNKRKIHPFQYILVGLALCLFYVLLVSITEHTDFNFAFGVSTIGIVSMISLYSISVFKNKKMSMLLVAVLTAIYSFLFVTLQMADYALLMGSVGLILILGATMYFTRNINWYKLNFDNE
ncbi:MAG: cell envelope integrity protein CreD [Bacteroidetes bacterium]|nr:MAG: cell envelope integrity protein CreD [Bacteroidota bacterium]MBL1144743.1 cell envelope integrity protein CreD [Bacteroidota bacterium]NOG57537.1 cell envelope integrity protein CreD [Bacteroidota bacterium]